MTHRDHEYTVELRVWGDSLDPDVITRQTGLQPCQTRRAGASMGSRIYRSSMWAFDAGAHGRYLSLEEGLTLVLDRVEAFQQVFAAYKG